MALKEFRSYQDSLAADETVIGGVDRHRLDVLPAGLAGTPGLVVASDSATVEAFRALVSGTKSPLVVEVGSGPGRFLTSLAAARPDAIHLGCETRLSFCLHTLQRAAKAGLENVRMAWGDARFTLPMLVEPGRADEAYLLFPDPWWKRRHARRRHGAVMSQTLADLLKPGGRLIVKSDVPEYLDAIVASFRSTGSWEDAPIPDDLPPTDRELRIVRNGTKFFTAAFLRR